MTEETGGPQATRRSSEARFFVAVALVMLVVIGGGIYLLRPAGDGDAVSSMPPSTGPTVQQVSPAAPSTSPTTSPTSTSADAQQAGGAAGALAVVRKAFRLSEAGQYAASCALESPTYLKFDAGHYPRGSCAAQQRADSATFAAQGQSLHLTSATVVASTTDTATVVAVVTIGSRVVSEHIYLRHHAGRWWMTGADDSGGDLGY